MSATVVGSESSRVVVSSSNVSDVADVVDVTSDGEEEDETKSHAADLALLASMESDEEDGDEINLDEFDHLPSNVSAPVPGHSDLYNALNKLKRAWGQHVVNERSRVAKRARFVKEWADKLDAINKVEEEEEEFSSSSSSSEEEDDD